jgi:hypothetical protein
MSVSRRDIEAALTDLADLISTVPDPRERLALLEHTSEVLDQTVGPTSDKAIYDLRLSLPSIAETVYESGWKTWRVKAAIRRHCEREGLPTPYEGADVKGYIPIM